MFCTFCMIVLNILGAFDFKLTVFFFLAFDGPQSDLFYDATASVVAMGLPLPLLIVAP